MAASPCLNECEPLTKPPDEAVMQQAKAALLT